MTRAEAQRILARLHEAQAAFYAGGPAEPLYEVLTDDILWVVPGDNAIAGEYRGIAAVLEYFSRRRDLADRTFRMHPGDLLVGDGDRVAALTDGTATIGGVQRRWSTVGLYELRGERVAACWLLPLDAAAFDAIWSACTGPPDTDVLDRHALRRTRLARSRTGTRSPCSARNSSVAVRQPS